MFLFGTNLKMHQTPHQTRAFVRALREHVKSVSHIEQVSLWITPPFTSIEAATDVAQGSRITVGAQNMHWADEGAFTGEISAAMLKACGAEFVMLGHAERRTLFGETEDALNRKVLAAAKHGLDIMLCVGEPADAKDAGTGDVYVERQLRLALASYSSPSSRTAPVGLIVPGGEGVKVHERVGGWLTILYEPLWSVGAGGTAADPAYVSRAFDNIRRVLVVMFGRVGALVPILYGGSVNEHNCAQYAQLPQASGMGVGRAGWQIDSFVQVLTHALNARQKINLMMIRGGDA